MSSSIFFVLGIVLYIALTFAFKKVFYKGKIDSNNWMVFNLSIYAEIALVFLFLSIGVFEIVNLCMSMPIWYNWIFPVFWLLYFLIRAFYVFVNRNNFFKISESNFKYRVRNEEGNIKIVSYSFRERESAAPSFSRSGWFLKIWSSEDETDFIDFDLKDLNLEGFKVALEECLLKSKTAKKSI